MLQSRILLTVIAAAVFLLSAILPVSAAMPDPCDAAAAHGVDGCTARQIILLSKTVDGVDWITSELFELDPNLLYWACCAADLAGVASPTLEQGVFLVKLRVGTAVVDHCAEPISTVPDEGYAIWAKKGGSAALYGWPGPAGDPSALCTSPFVAPDAGAVAAGTAWLVSVPAASIPDEE